MRCLVRLFINILNYSLILYAGSKRKQALLRSNLPGINPVADEVIRFKVWVIPNLFYIITLEAHMP